MNSTFDTSKRFTLSAIGSAALVVTTGGILIPKDAKALEPALTVGLLIAIVPSMITAITNFFSVGESSKIEREKLAWSAKMEERKIQDLTLQQQAKYINDWLYLGVTNGKIEYHAAVDGFSRTLTNMRLANNFDGVGTMVSVKDGVLFLDRGRYNGQLHAASTEFATSTYQSTGAVPIPVDNPRSLDRDEKKIAIKKIADSVKMDDTKFAANYVVGAGRKFSSADSPTLGGADKTLYSVFNRQQLESGNAKANFLATT